MQYMNTGILLMLSNADFQNTSLSSILGFISNKYDDFTHDWYMEVGPQIVLTMIIDAVMP